MPIEKSNTNRPNHFQKNLSGEYFLTGRMLDGLSLMKEPDNKHEFEDVFFNLCEKYDFDPIAWVICNNHYHLIFYCDYDFDFASFVRRLHSVTSLIFNRLDETSGRQIWYQYWDRKIRSEKDFWQHINYCHYNPIKHRYVSDTKELLDYSFSSFPLWKDVLGDEVIELFFESYPIDDFDPFAQE